MAFYPFTDGPVLITLRLTGLGLPLLGLTLLILALVLR